MSSTQPLTLKAPKSSLRPYRTDRGIIYVVAAAGFLVALIWWFSNSAAPADTSTARLIALGRLLGLVAGYASLMQLVLMARLKFLERALGQERLIWLHRWNGYIMFYSLMLHPILLSLGYQIAGEPGFIAQYLNFVLDYPHVLRAFIAAMLIVLIAGLSAVIVRRRLKYETWYYVHLSTYLAIYLAFAHQLVNGGDFLGHGWFQLYWRVLYVAAFSLAFVFRFGVPTVNFLRFKTRISSVTPEVPGVYSLHVTGRNLEQFKVRAGQFITIRVLTPGLVWQAHPFSVSGLPAPGGMRLTFRALGDYTRKLPLVTPGTPLFIDGPRGSFTWNQAPAGPVLMVAGGIGITPIMALLEDAPINRDIVVVYTARNKADHLFAGELETVARKKGVTLHLIGTDAQGRLDAAMLERLCPDAGRRTSYICGPEGMVTSLREILERVGVPEHRIITERFSF